MSEPKMYGAEVIPEKRVQGATADDYAKFGVGPVKELARDLIAAQARIRDLEAGFAEVNDVLIGADIGDADEWLEYVEQYVDGCGVELAKNHAWVLRKSAGAAKEWSERAQARIAELERELERARGESATQLVVAARSHDHWRKVAEDSQARIAELEWDAVRMRDERKRHFDRAEAFGRERDRHRERADAAEERVCSLTVEKGNLDDAFHGVSTKLAAAEAAIEKARDLLDQMRFMPEGRIDEWSRTREGQNCELVNRAMEALSPPANGGE